MLNNTNKKIDIVIPWCGNDFDPKIHTSKEHIMRQKNNNELYYCLDSIRTFASWINKIYILVNEIHVPDYIPEPQKTIFIDRTQLFDGKKITNGLVAETLSWKIPEISEYFILAHDDIILGRQTLVSDFFEKDKPVYYHYIPRWGPFINKRNHRIYQNSKVFTGDTPTSCGPYPHLYIGMRKSFCEKIEEQHKEWFSFMRSHYETRYSSEDKNYSMEEDFKGIFTSYLINNNLGFDKSKSKLNLSYSFCFLEYNSKCFDTRFSINPNEYISCEQSIQNFKNYLIKQKNSPLFINFNSVHNNKDIDNIWNLVKNIK
jgi:hypothetical protein